ncbi:MAG: hypothetical protein K8T10_06800 [Candidatus Eremiobacteraeota bacterium]|nr:hypothetical protein [Candidatus Eremiobacteraeota bacterium]
MRKRYFLFAVVVLILLSIALTLPNAYAKTKKPPPDYMPMAVGYWWKYKMVENKQEFTIKVIGKEKVGDVMCYKLETLASNGKVMMVEYYSKQPGKVMWHREKYVMAKQTVDFKPLRTFILNPLYKGAKWSWKGKGMMDVDIEESAIVTGFEKVEVPAGKFGTAKVDIKIIQGGQEVPKTYWYAPNIGMVKSLMKTTVGDKNVVLIKYNLKRKK